MGIKAEIQFEFIPSIFLMRQAAILITLLIIGSCVRAETVMGTDAPECWGKPIENESQVKCIAFFLGKFSSTLNPHGEEFDVLVELKENIWYVYPKSPSVKVPADIALYQIEARTGLPVGWKANEM